MAIDILKSNPFKRGSHAYRFFEICNIDLKDGHSDVIGIDVLEAEGLGFGNGGGWCRSDGPLGKYFNIHRARKGCRIVSVQLTGYKQNEFSDAIDRAIVEAYKGAECRALAVRGKYVEIDHKDGRKQDFKLHDNQTIDDFQPLHKNVNVSKRQHCKDCKATGVRFDARRLGYSVPQFIGPERYNGSCIGCYWHDIRIFNAKVSDKFNKNR